MTSVANGLGPGSGDGPMQPTDSQPTVTVGCTEAEVTGSFFSTDFGSYQANFTVPADTPGGLIPTTIGIGGVTSPSVLLPVSGDPVPAICAAVNAGSFAADQAVAPGSILTVFGVNLSEATNLSAFPNTLVDGVAVTFNGTGGPLFALTPGQLNVLVPPDLPEMGTVDVEVMTAAGTSSSFQLELTSAAPGVFPVRDPRDSAKLHAAALHLDTAWLPVPAAMAQALGIPTDCAANLVDPAAICGEPVRRGEVLQVFLTGLGRATVDGDPNGATLPAGEVAAADGSVIYQTLELPTMTIGGIEAEVLFSGLAPGFAGVNQLNAIVPEGAPAGDEIELTITAANGMSTTVLVALQ